MKKESRPFAGRVWCPTTKYGTWVAKSNDTISITGNSLDGIREFDTSSAVYRSLDIEFLFQPQENGITPIVPANPADFSLTAMAYYLNTVYIAYTGQDNNRYRLAWHSLYRRWRNDSVPATIMLLEEDTNTLLWGDANGLIHQDGVGFYDEASNAGTLTTGAIALNLQSGYLDQGAERTTKQYQNLALDLDTNGQTLTWTLLFDQGEGTIVTSTGTVSTTARQKLNIPINGDQGQTAYRTSLQITGSVTAQAIIYQTAIEGLILAEARRVWDSYIMTDDIEGSKIAKDCFFQYSATQTVTISVYYDQGQIPVFQTTLPASARITTRFRLPAVKFRLRRITAVSTADFQVWSATINVKPTLATQGFQQRPMFTT